MAKQKIQGTPGILVSDHPGTQQDSGVCSLLCQAKTSWPSNSPESGSKGPADVLNIYSAVRLDTERQVYSFSKINHASCVGNYETSPAHSLPSQMKLLPHTSTLLKQPDPCIYLWSPINFHFWKSTKCRAEVTQCFTGLACTPQLGTKMESAVTSFLTMASSSPSTTRVLPLSRE